MDWVETLTQTINRHDLLISEVILIHFGREMVEIASVFFTPLKRGPSMKKIRGKVS